MCVHSVDFERQVIKLSLKAPRATLTGWYDVKGSILGLPLNGQGECHIFVGEYGYSCSSDTQSRLKDLGILVRFASAGHMHTTHTRYTINTKHVHNTHAQLHN